MEPVHFNCKSASRQRNRKRCAPPQICSPGVLGSLSIHLHYFHHFFFFFNFRVFLKKLFPLASWPRRSWHVILRVCLWLWAFLKCILFSISIWVRWFPTLRVCLPSNSILPLPLITSPLCLSPSFPSQAPCENLRTPSTYPGNMLPHHPGQANFEDFTCWADPGRSIKSACYATKANHTTRTVQHGECEELIPSLTEALFT